MKVKIKRLTKEVSVPAYQTPGSVAFDLAPKEDVTIAPKEMKLLPTGLVICTPPGCMFMIASRSSTPKKYGVMLPHSVGIIDQDYSGPADEVMLQVYNFTDKAVEIKAGTRVAQGVFVKIEKAEWEEVETVEAPTRGGFGSTGH